MTMHRLIRIPLHEKPLLRLTNSPYGRRWICMSPGGAGFGESPAEAYQRWDWLRAKSE